MNKFLILNVLLFVSSMNYGQSTVEGLWTTIDDEDGKPSSIVKIQMIDNQLTATIKEVFDQPQDLLCENCTGDKYNKPIVGLQIISGMTKKGRNWSGGKILDPENGKTYKCKIELD